MTDSPDIAEARMRAALNLPRSSFPPAPAAPRGRHRFVQDGEVPVVMVNPRHPRPDEDRTTLAGLERDLAAERAAREAAEKALRQAEATIRQLQTRLAHAEMARQEVVPVPAPAPPPAEAVASPPLPKPIRQRAPRPPKDETVEWWKPGWKERFRQRAP